MSTLGHPKIKTNNDKITLSRRSKTYFCLVFFIRLGRTSCENTFVKGIELEDTNARSNFLVIHFSQIARANGFSNQKCKIFQKLLLFHIILSKRLFRVKKSEMYELDIFALFSASYLSKCLLIVEYFFFKKLIEIQIICINVFFQKYYSTLL
jgi:hypothetical protein